MGERKIDVLVVRWYERAGRDDIAARWLDAAREHLPEAMPRRFGDTEPLRGRLDRDGEEGFLRAYDSADSLLFISGKGPVHHASLSATRPGYFGPTVAHSLHAELPATDPRVHRFARALLHPSTIYVSASIEGGEILDGDTLYGPPERPGEPFLAPVGDWLGLPPRPPIWCWFGPAYQRLVRRQVTGEKVADGLFWSGGPWVREPLHARLSEPDPNHRAALRTPRGLRRSTLQIIMAGLHR
ncbi:hypothetical protein AB0M02_38560 [Actinoplanes sp. NPDC051861]|uniref:hypothetical protein n=1 Tax=Actinoplanes sp. NPDC051861 TaxID=3155170 RepID=UPI003426E39D